MLSKKLKDATLADVQTERKDLYDEIYSQGEASANEEKDEKIAGLTKQVAEFEKEKTQRAEKDANEKLIKDSSKKLGIPEKGEELIANGTPVQEALTILINEANKEKGDLQGAFERTAPPAAGDPTASELDLEEPRTQTEARDFCMKKYGCASKKDAWRHARTDFPALFGSDKEPNKTDGGK